MKILFLWTFLIVLAGLPCESHGADVSTTKLKKRLYKEKQSFDQYLAQRAKDSRPSQRVVAEHKKKRQRTLEKNIKARKGFKRVRNAFPVKAYRRYIADRDQRIEQRERTLKTYRAQKKQRRRILNLKKYKIDKMKAYSLE